MFSPDWYGMLIEIAKCCGCLELKLKRVSERSSSSGQRRTMPVLARREVSFERTLDFLSQRLLVLPHLVQCQYPSYTVSIPQLHQALTL